MSAYAPLLAALAGLFLGVWVARVLWDPLRNIALGFSEAIPFHNVLEALVIACSGARHAGGASQSWRIGLTNQPHDQLNLTQRQYSRGLLVASVLAGAAVALFMGLALQSWVALPLGVFAAICLRGLFQLAISSAMAQNFEEQLRQFPFFLDIFQLHVQAGGDLNASIDSYRAIYGNDPIGRELAILQESYPSFGVADSFDRLRNRVGNTDLKNVIGELAQKIRVGSNLEQTLAEQSNDMRELREELAAKRANELNAKFNFPVVLATVATFLIFLSPAIALIYDSGFL